MKRKLSIELWVLSFCMASITLLPGCEQSVVDPCKEQTDLRIQQFKEYCYDVAGNVALAHPDGYTDTEWMIPVGTDKEVATVFSRITGLQIHSSEQYEYSYRSEDRRYVCRLIGESIPDDLRYATLHIWVEGCPEIETIHFIGIEK